MKKKHLGILYIIMSSFSFALMNVFAYMSGELPSIQKSFFRNLIAFFVALFIMIKNKESFKIQKGSLTGLIFRSVFGTIGIICNYYSIDHLVLADASILNKMAPFFAVIFSLFVLKEKITPFQGMAVIAAFIGSMFIIKPTFSNMDLFPSLIGLLGGMSAGVAYTIVRKLGNSGVRGSQIVLFFSGFSCLVTLPYLLFHYVPMSAEQLGFLLLAGLAAAGGQFSVTAAYVHAPAREISVYDYSQIPFAALLGFFVFGQVSDFYSVIGYSIIIGTAILMFFYKNPKLQSGKKSS